MFFRRLLSMPASREPSRTHAREVSRTHAREASRTHARDAPRTHAGDAPRTHARPCKPGRRSETSRIDLWSRRKLWSGYDHHLTSRTQGGPTTHRSTNRDRTPDDRIVSPCLEPPAHPPRRQAHATTRRRARGR